MEDVSNLTKEEFLKFLNCSQHGLKPEKILINGPRNTKIGVLKQFGKFSARNVQLNEFSLNKQILRIPLPRVDLKNLSPAEVAQKFKKFRKRGRPRKKTNAVISRFGRKLKKKQLNIQGLTSSFITTRSSSQIVTRSLDKAPLKPLLKTSNTATSLKPNLFQKTVKRQYQFRHPNKMATGAAPLRQYSRSDKLKPPKPQFIIKYVPSEPTYFLKMPPIKHPEDGKLKYPFDTLVKDIKNMKLPSPTWKIKVVVKSNKIASIIFTNKCVLERTVSFNAKSEFFEVVIENKPAILLGCPSSVTCVEDIEILLNIIHTISAQNQMVYYK